jgi:hypothetical protein
VPNLELTRSSAFFQGMIRITIIIDFSNIPDSRSQHLQAVSELTETGLFSIFKSDPKDNFPYKNNKKSNGFVEMLNRW